MENEALAWIICGVVLGMIAGFFYAEHF